MRVDACLLQRPQLDPAVSSWVEDFMQPSQDCPQQSGNSGIQADRNEADRNEAKSPSRDRK
jgi:hypothetical protein